MFDWMKREPKKADGWTERWDVVVLGSGAAGLVAAGAAAQAGARVLVLEKAERLGGTTAVSGGVVWVPNNPHLAEVGITDSREDAARYLRRIADGRADDALLERFLDVAPAMVAWVEEHLGLRFTALARYPDYHPELPGGRPGGRSMEAGLFDTRQLGDLAPLLRRSPVFGATPMTVLEATTWGVFHDPLSLPYRELGKRFKEGLVGYGGALVGGLLLGCRAKGVQFRTGVAARELVMDGGRVTGVVVDGGRLGASRGVVVATGGFEWDEGLARRFLGGVPTHPNSPPTNRGDGLRMVMGVGAELGNMNEAWWCPSVDVPGETYDGVQLHRGDFAIRSLPHSILVNRAGRRFVNEAGNYNDLLKPFFTFDPGTYDRPNLPAWLVLDRQFVERYILITSVPGMEPPEWVVRADTLPELARLLGVDAEGLVATVTRFNGHVAAGRDADFGRGESVYDHFYGDPKRPGNPNLGSIEKPPFYALQVHPGAIGTKGGAVVDEHARVRRALGGIVPGLYAAGNVTASVMGAGYPGAGATIAAAMTFGWLAGRHLGGIDA